MTKTCSGYSDTCLGLQLVTAPNQILQLQCNSKVHVVAAVPHNHTKRRREKAECAVSTYPPSLHWSHPLYCNSWNRTFVQLKCSFLFLTSPPLIDLPTTHIFLARCGAIQHCWPKENPNHQAPIQFCVYTSMMSPTCPIRLALTGLELKLYTSKPSQPSEAGSGDQGCINCTDQLW